MGTSDRLRRFGEERLEALGRALERTGPGRFALDVALAGWAVARGFRGEKISLRASALTYISIFALVPLLTVALGLVEFLGRSDLHASLREFLLDLLAPGIAAESLAFLESFMQTAASATAGGLGLAVLLVSAGTLLKNLDTSLNEIWDVRRKRPVALRWAIYLAIMLLGPVLLALSLAGMGALRATVTPIIPFSGQLLTAAGALVAVVGFTFLYLVGPNVRVRFRSALAGGLVAGLGWDLAKHLYGELATQLFRASPVWGSLTAVPLFLTWLYLSWLLLLFGARLAYAVQYAWFRGGSTALDALPGSDAVLAGKLALAVAEAAITVPLGIRGLALRLGASEEALEPILERLIEARVLHLLPEGHLAPGRPPGEQAGGAHPQDPAPPTELEAQLGAAGRRRPG